MALNLGERIAFCLGIEDQQKTKRNKKLFKTQVPAELRNKFIEKWFSTSLSILDTKVLQKDFINILNTRGHEEEIDSIEESIFSLAISCIYIERYGIENVNRQWFKNALMEWLEGERLGLTIGNLQFYQLLTNVRHNSEIIPGSLIKQIYKKHLPLSISKQVKEKDLYAFLDRQSILLKVSQTLKEEKFIFCSYNLRKAIKNPIFKAECKSTILAQKYLIF